MGVAKATVATARQAGAVTDLDEIGDQRGLILRVDLRSRRQRNQLVRASRAGAVLAHAGAAVLGLKVLLVAVIDQGVETGHALSPDIPALAAVAAVGAAELDEFLAPEGDGAGTAVAGADVDLGLVQKFHKLRRGRPLSQRRSGPARCASAAAPPGRWQWGRSPTGRVGARADR